MSDATVVKAITTSPFDRNERDILLRSLAQFQHTCDEQALKILELSNQISVLPQVLGESAALEAEIERLKQENAALRMRLEDMEL